MARTVGTYLGRDQLSDRWRRFHNDWLKREEDGEADMAGGDEWRRAVAAEVFGGDIPAIAEALWYVQCVADTAG
jgi:hypothetical protein